MGYLNLNEYPDKSTFLYKMDDAFAQFFNGRGNNKLGNITASKTYTLYNKIKIENHEGMYKLRKFTRKNGNTIYFYVNNGKLKVLLKGNYDDDTRKLFLKRKMKEEGIKKKDLYIYHVEINDKIFDGIDEGAKTKYVMKYNYPELLVTNSYFKIPNKPEIPLYYPYYDVSKKFYTLAQITKAFQYYYEGKVKQKLKDGDFSNNIISLVLDKFKVEKVKKDKKPIDPNKPIRFKDYGIKAGMVVPYNTTQQKQFIKTNYTEKHPLLSKKLNKVRQSLQYKMKLKIVLKKHQKDFIVNFLNSFFKGGLLFHTVGSGKTLTAVAFSHYYLSLFPNKNVCIISPPALLFNFTDALKEYGLDIRDSRYKFQTYGKFLKDVDSYIDKDTLLIIDEVHNFRTEIQQSITGDDINGYTDTITGNKSGFELIQACFKANKILAMTGTPFVNKLYDIENTMAMITQRNPVEPAVFETITEYDVRTYDYFKYRISHFDVSHTDDIKFYPEKREIYVPIILDKKHSYVYNEVLLGRNPFDSDSKKTYKSPSKSPKWDSTTDRAYQILKTLQKRGTMKTFTGIKTLAEQEQLTSFKGKIRQYGNIIGNYKIKYIIRLLKKNPTFKTIIYSSFISSALKPLMTELSKKKIKYVSITGEESTTKKQQSKLIYNDINSGVNVLIISSAGTEGVSTKNTRQFVLFESQWNEALTEQAVARAIRFKSHSQLPPSENYCNIYKLTICSNESDIKDVESFNSGAFENLKAEAIKLNDLRNRRKMSIYIRYENLNKIKVGRYSGYLDKLNKMFIAQSKEAHKKMRTMFRKKPPWEYNKDEFITYAIDKIAEEYVKNRAQLRQSKLIEEYIYLTEERKKLGEGSDLEMRQNDSGDIALIKISIRKKVIINGYIGSLDEYVPMIEDYKEPLHNKLIKAIDKNQNVDKLLKKQIKILDKIGDRILENSDYVNGMLLYGNKKKAVSQEDIKKRLRSIEKRQEFYTPQEIAVLVAKLSNIINSKEHIRILEPTCGQGNLLRELVNIRSDIPDIGTTYDMCEINPDSRKILELFYVKKDPAQFILAEEPDFLQYIPSEPYNLIIMNPPFHLKKKLTGYDRDYWDIDFVMRAYGMLKLGGELIAIVSLNLSHGLKRYDDFINNHVEVIQEYENYKWNPFGKKTKELKIGKKERKKKNQRKDPRAQQMSITLNFQIIKLIKTIDKPKKRKKKK
tara:strand:+ start:615 stop:4226 length:3612 start_codon:yes stop_codon:yes gene_type:complete